MNDFDDAAPPQTCEQCGDEFIPQGTETVCPRCAGDEWDDAEQALPQPPKPRWLL